jgi:acyl carrier protein
MRLLREEVPDIDYSKSETMADDGLLDSLALTSILGALSSEFDVEIPYDQITPENFNSIKTIAELMRNLVEIEEVG